MAIEAKTSYVTHEGYVRRVLVEVIRDESLGSVQERKSEEDIGPIATVTLSVKPDIFVWNKPEISGMFFDVAVRLWSGSEFTEGNAELLWQNLQALAMNVAEPGYDTARPDISIRLPGRRTVLETLPLSILRTHEFSVTDFKDKLHVFGERPPTGTVLELSTGVLGAVNVPTGLTII